MQILKGTNRDATVKKRLLHTCVEHGGHVCGANAPLARHLLRTSGAQIGSYLGQNLAQIKAGFFVNKLLSHYKSYR